MWLAFLGLCGKLSEILKKRIYKVRVDDTDKTLRIEIELEPVTFRLAETWAMALAYSLLCCCTAT